MPSSGVKTCALPIDRKSTRLNSNHLGTSYAVFCLKKRATTAGGRSSRRPARWGTAGRPRGPAAADVGRDEQVDVETVRVAGVDRVVYFFLCFQTPRGIPPLPPPAGLAD